MSKSQKDEAFLDVLKNIVFTIADSAGVTEALATELANQIIRHLQKEYGTENVYIHAQDRAEKKRQILADWNGNNIDDLVEKHKVSKRRIYQILNER